MWLSRLHRPSTRFAALLAALALAASPAAAQTTEVRIDLIKDPARRIRVALPAFFDAQRPAAELDKLRETLAADLRLSGFFEVVTELPPNLVADGRAGMEGGDLFDRLLALRVELLLNVHDRSPNDALALEAFVYDPATRHPLFGKRYRGPSWAGKKLVHVLAGEVIRALTGVHPLTGSRLAYVSNASGRKQVFVGDYDGGDARAVSPAGELALFPEWLPDGKGLVFTSFATGFPELVYRDVDAGHQKVLAAFPGMNAGASFAPDGSHFLVTLSKDGNPDLYKVDLRGKVLQRMTNDPGVDTSPCYSPDGSRFAFVSDRSGGPQVYVMPASGGKPVRITFQGKYNVSPDWSPSGRRLAYSSNVGGRFELMLLDPDTGEVEQLTSGPGNKEDPDWGPDDRHLVFTLTRDHKSDVYMIDTHHRDVTRITSGKGGFSSPVWSQGEP